MSSPTKNLQIGSTLSKITMQVFHNSRSSRSRETLGNKAVEFHRADSKQSPCRQEVRKEHIVPSDLHSKYPNNETCPLQALSCSTPEAVCCPSKYGRFRTTHWVHVLWFNLELSIFGKMYLHFHPKVWMDICVQCHIN